MSKSEERMADQEETVVMAEQNEADVSSVAADDEDSLVIKFKKPYLFEGKEYMELDLSVLEDMTAADMIAIENKYDRKHPGLNVMPEVKVGYAMMMAARAAGLPIEFFDGLPQKEAMKVKNRVMGFLFGPD